MHSLSAVSYTGLYAIMSSFPSYILYIILLFFKDASLSKISKRLRNFSKIYSYNLSF